jgi:hypothetical protein
LKTLHLHNTFSRDKFTIHSKAVVCQDVELKGDITIGSGIAIENAWLALRSSLMVGQELLYIQRPPSLPLQVPS